MATPANRAKIQLVRGTYANISASIADLVDGELCYAKDQNRLYMVEGSTLTQVEADPEDIEGLIASIIVGGTGLTSTHDDANDTVTLDLDDTAVTAGSYGSGTEIPTFTVDAQGRITAAGTASISTDMTVAADSGSDQIISIGTDTFTISGGTGLNSVASTDTVTLNLSNTGVTAGTYGSTTGIASFTVDATGRLSAASEIDAPPVLVEVHNQTGGTLTKGIPVYVSGTHSSGKPTVAEADNNGSGTYPAIGLVYSAFANGSDGYVIISGLLNNVSTGSFSAGDALYLGSSPGSLTSTRPTASTSKVQKVGLVTRSHASSGSILIIGAGRTNDITNELVALTGVTLNDSDLGTFTGTTITDNSSIKTALQELETAVETEQTSTTGNFTVGGELRGPSTFYIDPSAYGDDTGTVVIRGGLTVNGTTTTIDSTTLTVDDKNIELGSVATPTDTTADGGGITLKGATDKTINWIDSSDSWTFSEHIDLAATKQYYLNGTMVLGYSGSDRVLDNVIIDGGTY